MIHLRHICLGDVSCDISEVDTLRTFCSVNTYSAVHCAVYIQKIYIFMESDRCNYQQREVIEKWIFLHLYFNLIF